MDEQRALLDQLMGSQRDIPDHKKREVHFYDREIDKFWLLGVQPFDLFRNTSWSPRLASIYRGSMGYDLQRSMGREQPLAVLPEWNALPQDKQDSYGYEHELCIFLEALIRSCDKNVEKARDAHERGATDVTPQEAQQLLDLETKIAEIQKRSEAAAESGDVDTSLSLLAEVDQLEQKKRQVGHMEEKTKKVLVCEVSGNVVQNTEIRIQEHYQGRLYLGWKKVRDRYALIKDKYKDKRHPNPQWRHRTKGEKEAAGKERAAPRSYSRRDDRRDDDRYRRDDYRRDGYDRPRSRDERSRDERPRDERSRDDDRRRPRSGSDDRRRRRSRSRSRGRSRYDDDRRPRYADDDDPRSRYDSRSRYYR